MKEPRVSWCIVFFCMRQHTDDDDKCNQQKERSWSVGRRFIIRNKKEVVYVV